MDYSNYTLLTVGCSFTFGQGAVPHFDKSKSTPENNEARDRWRKECNLLSYSQRVKEIVKFWGKGNITFKKNQKYYEQTNLQLNIEKSMKILKWQPKYTITKSVQVTAEWYKKVLTEKFSVEKITEKQIKDYMNEYK